MFCIALHPSMFKETGWRMLLVRNYRWHLCAFVLVFLGSVECGHYLNADGTPHDMYHDLHLPHDPPLYPTFREVPHTSFNCAGREWGLHADTEAHCQAYHLCQDRIVQSFLCPNATLFHNQFKVCDQFYNVRCGWDLDDL